MSFFPKKTGVKFDQRSAEEQLYINDIQGKEKVVCSVCQQKFYRTPSKATPVCSVFCMRNK